MTLDKQELINMLITVGIDSYLAGQNTNITMKPSLIAEKFIYGNILTEEDKEKISKTFKDGLEQI